jgi:hypothetical protein
MAKKMCRYWKPRDKDYCSGEARRVKQSYMCPKGTNSNCEIITRKPKMVKVEIFVRVSDYGNILGFSQIKGDNWLPCTAIMPRKYLKGSK